jgi:ferredoxin
LIIFAALLLTLWPAGVQAIERFPPPDFTNHPLPTIETPPAKSVLWEYSDLGFLTAALILATYFALVRRSRTGLFLLSMVSLVWLGFRREGCICAIGSLQNVALAVCDSRYAIPLSVVGFFALPLLFTLFFGRTFCASVCPLGAIQEVVAIRPIRVPAWLDHALGLLAYIYLGAAVIFAASGTGFIVCRYDPFVGFFRRTAGVGMLAYGGGLLLLGVFVGRPYCRYLCPYGAILGLLSKVSKWHLSIPPEKCINCRLCEDACPYGAIREPNQPLTGKERPWAQRRLAVALVLLPLLLLGGGWLGSQLAVALSRMHPVVRLAERVRMEETGKVEGTVDASDAFRNTGRPREELYREAIRRRAEFGRLGLWLGVWVGLVIAIKLIYLCLRRRREDYQPDRAGCVSCGRCFWYCPEEQTRQGLIRDLPLPGQPPQSTPA